MFDESNRPNATWYTLDKCIEMAGRGKRLHVCDVTPYNLRDRVVALQMVISEKGVNLRMIEPSVIGIGEVWIYVVSQRSMDWERKIDGYKYFLKQTENGYE